MKAVTMYRPMNFENALSEFDRYLESFFGDSPLSSGHRYFNHLPPMDIRETDNAYVLEMELPGYDEKQIQIGLDGGTLTIESKVEDENTRDANEGKKAKDGKGVYLLRERRMSAFTRSFKLPENADPASVSAAFKNGILTMEMKKRTESQKRVIQINS